MMRKSLSRESLNDLSQTTMGARTTRRNLLNHRVSLGEGAGAVRITAIVQRAQMVGMQALLASGIEADALPPGAITCDDKAACAGADDDSIYELVPIHASLLNKGNRSTDQDQDLQASMPSDPHCRRRAFQLIALLYGLAVLANIVYWCGK